MNKNYVWVIPKEKKRLEYMVVPDRPIFEKTTPFGSPMSNVIKLFERYLRLRQLLK